MYKCINQAKIDIIKGANASGSTMRVPLPVYRTIRGPSQLESSHRLSNRLLSAACSMSPYVASHIMPQHDFESNVKAGIRNAGHTDFGTFQHDVLQHAH